MHNGPDGLAHYPLTRAATHPSIVTCMKHAVRGGYGYAIEFLLVGTI
jgi:hypothetical protein